MFVYCKLSAERRTGSRFASYVHPGRFIEESTPTLWTDSNSTKVYDPENLTIVSCTQEDWDLMASLPDERIARLRDYVTFFQGEVNQTVVTAKGFLTEPQRGHLVTRGANISLYQLREASQGQNIYLDVDAFLNGRGEETKAFHYRFERVGLQESSPQNNFRRIIACRIPQGCFCNHKINYTTEKHSQVPLEFLLFVLNSTFADWYFRLGSTNAAVSHYQLLRRPQFSWTRIKGESDVKGGGGHGSVEEGAGSGVGADGGSPEGERSRRRRRGGWGGGLGARPAVEREPETGRGVAAAARRVAGDGLA